MAQITLNSSGVASDGALALQSNGTTTAVTIDASQKVGIGTTSPATTLHIRGSVCNFRLEDSDTSAYANVGVDNSGSMYLQADPGNSQASTTIYFATDGTERMRIDSSGNVGIGTSSPAARFHVEGANAVMASTGLVTVQATTDGADIGGQITFQNSTARRAAIAGRQEGASAIAGYLQFGTRGSSGDITERARIDSSGNLLVGKTSDTFSAVGGRISPAGVMTLTADSNELANFNRLTNDGALLYFSQASTIEGTISVSGTTVTYGGGHLARFGQLPDGSEDPTLLKGTVLTNLDEMCVWINKETGIFADNEQCNKVKISDVEGDANVAGVFVSWTYDEQHDTNDLYVAMTGDMIIRIAQGTTVARGDLLMSAGDGTAKPQGDDIVRSKTVAKVTSTHVTCTYADGSFCVPCVLMAC
jgi:hypothetical protein